MTKHLLVTNDYPPKVGGIQQYLWELWKRLDPETFEVHTTPHRGADEFDAAQTHTIVRSAEPVLLPYPWLTDRLNRAADRFEADLHVIDPAVPLGIIGPSLDKPYAVVLHGAEVTIPGRAPVSRQVLGSVLRNASGVISAGQYALDEAEQCAGRPLRSVVVPPGVDVDRYCPIDEEVRAATRRRFGIAEEAPFVLSVSRLVPRKGMDDLVSAAARLERRHPGLVVAIAGAGRDHRRLQRLIDRTGAPVRLLGRVDEADKAPLYGSADVFAMLCRTRWGGLEQEGFGIVFLEAAAAGIPQVAGASGGAAEAVVDGETGYVVNRNDGLGTVVDRLDGLLGDAELRHELGAAARRRAVAEFAYDDLAVRLDGAIHDWATRPGGSTS